MTDDEILDHVLKFEGGYVNNPADHGGPTNFGITASTLGQWRNLGRPATPEEVQSLTRDEAKQIFKESYIVKPRFTVIANDIVRLIVVDSGVLHGTGRATKWLQQALGVAVDGDLGSGTETALQNANPAKTARGVLGLRIRSVGTIISHNTSQAVFAAGWLNRATTLLDYV